MAAFSSSEEATLGRRVASNEVHPTSVEDLSATYQLEKCEDWISTNNLTRVCLQFPDDLLCDSPNVALRLESSTNCQCFVLGDTSYGSCCVDEVSAEHIDADGIIHFGYACLSPTRRVPVLYIFKQEQLNVDELSEAFHSGFTDRNSKVILIYHVSYSHFIETVHERLSEDFKEIVQAYPANRKSEEGSTTCLGVTFILPSNAELKDYSIVFIGMDGRTLSNLVLEFAECRVWCYNPIEPKKGFQEASSQSSKFLMKRMHLVERVKDAATIGIVVGTLGVDGYLDAVHRIKLLAKASGKRTYIIAVGRPNVAKLANFPEIDVFVLVACPENSLLDWREFYQPLVSVYEVELACNPSRKWSTRYITDFRQMLPGGRDYVKASESVTADENSDVSLVTGKIRNLIPQQEVSSESAEGTLSHRSNMAVVGTGGHYLANRSWQGLEQKMGETPVELAKQGRSGIAVGYNCEKDYLNSDEN